MEKLDRTRARKEGYRQPFTEKSLTQLLRHSTPVILFLKI